MPKMKTDRGAAKRFKVTGTGQLRRRKAYRSHLLEKKSACARAGSAVRPTSRAATSARSAAARSLSRPIAAASGRRLPVPRVRGPPPNDYETRTKGAARWPG